MSICNLSKSWSVYGSCLWSLSSPALQNIEVAFNKILCRIWSLSPRSHSRIVHLVANLHSLFNVIYRRSKSLLFAATQCPSLVYIIIIIIIISTRFRFLMFAVHIPGVSNQVADAVSRDKSSLFDISHRQIQHPLPSPPPTAGSSDYTETRLDIKGLDDLVEHYFHHSLAPSTRRSYASASSSFLRSQHPSHKAMVVSGIRGALSRSATSAVTL